MRKARNIAIFLWLVIFAGLWLWAHETTMPNQSSVLQILYSGKLQSAFFTGFLTLAGFILSLKTNILLRLQKDLFEDPIYLQRVENASHLEGKQLSRSAPLINLGEFLIWTVLICLGAALVQITLGLIQTDWAVAGCFATVGSALVFVFFSWRAIRQNLRLWFELLREKDKIPPPPTTIK